MTTSSLTEQIAAATAAIHKSITDWRVRIRDIGRELQRVKWAPVPLEEIEARIPDVVAAEGARWLKENARAILHSNPDMRQPIALGTYNPKGPMRVGIPVEQLVSWGALCASEPASACKRLRSLARAFPYEGGPASLERPAILARLTREYAEAEATEERAIDEALGAGLAIAHRPEVLQRRNREASALEAAAKEVAGRAQLEAAIDERHGVQRSRPVVIHEAPAASGDPDRIADGADGGRPSQYLGQNPPRPR